VEQRSIPIGSFDSFHFSSDGFQGFVPGNSGEFAGAPCPGPFQRVKNPVRRIDPLTVGVASKAHARPPILLRNGLNSNNLPVPDVDLEIANSSTMAVAHGRDNFVLDISLLFVHQALLFGRNNTPRTDVVILAETVITTSIKLIITTSLSYGNFDIGCNLTVLADIFDIEDFVTESTIIIGNSEFSGHHHI
jgi:hypothetical protein